MKLSSGKCFYNLQCIFFINVWLELYISCLIENSKSTFIYIFSYRDILGMNFCLSRRDLNPGKILKNIGEHKNHINWNRLLNNLINIKDMTIQCKNKNYDLNQVDLLSDYTNQPCIISESLTIDLFK